MKDTFILPVRLAKVWGKKMKTEEKFAYLFDRTICEGYDARSIRDKILRETDKYLLVDYPVTAEYKQKIIDYRQSLRDISKQRGFPCEVDWGEFPEERATQENIEKTAKQGA